MTTKNVGTNSTARQVDAIMPENTVMPIDLRALAPAPVAATNGATPRMKANDVIKIGRKRERAAATADSSRGCPSRTRNSRAISTIRIAFFGRQGDEQDKANLDVEIVVNMQEHQHQHGAEQGEWHRED